MNRKFKVLGLAFFAALATSAVFIVSAQASTDPIVVDIPISEATVTGEQISHNGNSHHSFSTFFGTMTCTTAKFDGTVNDNDEFITVTPTYSGCTVAGTAKQVTITHNGCDYKFTGGNATSTDPNHFEGVTVSLECPVNVTGIEIKTYASEAAHTAGTVSCRYVVHPFEHKGHNTVVNDQTNEPDDLTITSTVTNVPIKRIAGGFFTCGSENQSSDYTGGSTLRAYSDEAHENQIDITLKDETP